LSHEDAVGIFGTAIKEAEAQKFEPTGDGSTAVHKSAMDFLTKAEDKYKKEKEAAAARQKADAEGAEAGSKRVTGEELEKRRREFDNMKPSLWKEEAKKNPQKYTPEQLDQMQKGKAPKGSDGEPMEIHHKKPLSEGGTNTWDNFEVMTRTDHRIKPNFKVNHPNLPRGRAK